VTVLKVHPVSEFGSDSRHMSMTRTTKQKTLINISKSLKFLLFPITHSKSYNFCCPQLFVQTGRKLRSFALTYEGRKTDYLLVKFPSLPRTYLKFAYSAMLYEVPSSRRKCMHDIISIPAVLILDRMTETFRIEK